MRDSRGCLSANAGKEVERLPDRFDGFLCSCMQEVAPGVYVAPRLKKAVRERVWNVM